MVIGQIGVRPKKFEKNVFFRLGLFGKKNQLLFFFPKKVQVQKNIFFESFLGKFYWSYDHFQGMGTILRLSVLKFA